MSGKQYKLRILPLFEDDRISVKNFTIFYVVIGDTMEVRRILYSRRDLTKHI